MASTASTNLVCFGVQDGASTARIYLSDRSGHVWELALLSGHSQRWVRTDITAAAATTGKAASSASRALACCGADGAKARVYHLDDMGHVWELAEGHNDSWSAADITAQALGNPPPARVDTTLACFSLDGIAPRVYFLDEAGHIWELARWVTANRWVATDVTGNAAGNPPPAAPHALACYGANGRHPRVYVQDGLGTGRVWELAWWEYARHWLATDITEAANNPARAAWGSQLACMGVDGAGPRVYFLELDNTGNGRVWELASWDETNSWVAADITDQAGAQPAAAGSRLACLPMKHVGSAARIYFLDTNGHVSELAWNRCWGSTDLTAAARAPGGVIQPAAAQSALACLGLNGNPRIYYLPSGQRGHVAAPESVAELSWQRRWISRTLCVVGRSSNQSVAVRLPFEDVEDSRPPDDAEPDHFSAWRGGEVLLW